jgi:hypothetical protein
MSFPGISLKRIYMILPYIALVYLALFHFDFMLDDPFISFRYARNLLDGHGLVFNPGERVEGYSNFLWIILLLTPMKLGFSPVIASKLLGLLFGMLTLYSAYELSLLVFADHTQKHHAAFYAVALTGASWYFSLWSVGGLETTLFSFLVSQSIYFLVKCEYVGGCFDWSFVFLSLAGMTRPEGPLFFVPFFLIKSFPLVKKHRGIKDLMIWSGGLTAAFGSYFLWRFFYYDQFLPNSYYAKTLGGTQQYLIGARYLLAFFSSQGRLFLVLFSFSLFGLSRLLLKNSVIRLLFLLFSCYAAFIVYAGGDWMCGFRFLAQVYPIYAILLASGLIESIDYVAKIFRWSHHTNLFALSLFSMTIASSLQSSYRDLRLSVPWLGNWFNRLTLSQSGSYYDVALYLSHNAPAGSWIALGEAGIIPYYAKSVNVIDLLGLMDRHVAHIPGLLHQKGDAEYVLSRNPDYVLLLVQEDTAGTIRYAAEPMRQFLTNKLFTERYVLVFKISRGGTETLRDMFYLYRKSDLPVDGINREVLGFKEILGVRLEANPGELVAGKSTLNIHVTNLNASSIDLFYTLNGKEMPVIHSWKLDSNHSAI